jgi:predicted  nucleic acid-binding Zn-ribbon protein
MAGSGCETCGGRLEDGVAGLTICLQCGAKFTRPGLPKASKGLTREDAPRPVVDNSQQVARHLDLARHALESGNLAEAERYATATIELDPDQFEAWIIKGRAAGWQSSLREMRLVEAVNCFARAIDLAPSAIAPDVKQDVSQQIGALAVAVIKTRANIYIEHPNEGQAEALKGDLGRIIDAVSTLLAKSGVTVPGIWEDIATAINNAVVEAWQETIWAEYSSERYPSKFDFDRFRDRVPYANMLLRMAIGLSSDDDAQDITRYKNLILFASKLRDAKSYRRTGHGYEVDYTLADDAKALNDEKIRSYHKEVQRLEREQQAQRERERQAKKEADLDVYWSATPERRAERTRLTAERDRLSSELKKLNDQKGSIPGVPELKTAREEIRVLTAELEAMGRFKRAERKELQDRIRALEARRDTLNTEVLSAQKSLGVQITTTEMALKEVTESLEEPR